jgi:hypothetical protein
MLYFNGKCCVNFIYSFDVSKICGGKRVRRGSYAVAKKKRAE